MKKIILSLGFIAFLASCGSDNSMEKEVQEIREEVITEEADLDALPKVHLQWTAFKTEERVGVKGNFQKMQIVNYSKDANTIEGKINYGKVIIDESTVDTGDPARDNTLYQFFFKHLGGPIEAEFGELADGIAPVSITMNNKTAEKNFDYELNGNTIKIKGTIDILKDFQASEAFDSLHKQCYDLHEGVTGTDVAIEVEVIF